MKALVALAIAFSIACLIVVMVIAVWASIRDAPWEDGDGGTAKPVAPIATGFKALSYKEKNDICHEFATYQRTAGMEVTVEARYKVCMQCGPERVVTTKKADGSYTYSCQ
jgi:hypothetical protein